MRLWILCWMRNYPMIMETVPGKEQSIVDKQLEESEINFQDGKDFSRDKKLA